MPVREGTWGWGDSEGKECPDKPWPLLPSPFSQLQPLALKMKDSSVRKERKGGGGEELNTQSDLSALMEGTSIVWIGLLGERDIMA